MMSPESPGHACDRFRDELLRIACGDVPRDDVSPAVEAHLQACPRCAQRLEEACGTVDALSALLRPDPLPAALERRIQAELDERGTLAASNWLRWRAPFGAAAAAVLLATVLLPFGQTQAPIGQHTTQVGPASAADPTGTAIAAAVSVLEWSEPWDYSVSHVTSQLENLERTVSGQSSEGRSLPWAADDDWDVPSATGDGSSQSGKGDAGRAPETRRRDVAHTPVSLARGRDNRESAVRAAVAG